MKGNIMFNITNETIIYVVCPAYKKTGGTELAHQLVNELSNDGVNAIITYYGSYNSNSPINPAFLEYVREFKMVADIVDDKKNVLIVPEIQFDLVDKYQNIQKAIWWMSVDNYIKNDGFIGACRVNGFYKALRGVLSGRLKVKKKGFDKAIVHFYQSAYALDFLKKSGVSQAYRLSDYINDSYLNTITSQTHCRNDVVLYNPKKGYGFTKKLMDASNDIKWVPIENLTTLQVRDLLEASKVYVDFGNHPGKDRFPREAAIMGCCVITGRRGSAAFHEDIPINDEYKFGESKSDIGEILEKVRCCLGNYEEESKNFEEYKKMIRNEHNIFKEDVQAIIS